MLILQQYILLMQPQQLEAIAHKACFQIDQQERLNASNSFINFMYSLHPQHFSQIMQNFSPNVLFVFCEYINKYFSQYVEKGHQVGVIFAFVQKVISHWFTQNGLLVRKPQQKALQKYIRNSVSILLGRVMKQVFISPSQKRLFLQYLKQITNLRYKIFVYKSFIEAVSTIQTKGGYLAYRTLIYNFQDQIIPMITQDLVPFFIGVTEKIKVNQLSCMMPRLQQSQKRQPIILFREEDKPITEMTFNLLKQVTNFTYNISFNQYDLQTVYDNCLISFPQSLISKIISKQFLQSLYFVIQQIVNVGDKDHYLMICFQCLKKILLTKTSLCNKQTVFTYIKINLKGLNSLFINPQLSGPRLADLIQCAQKFIVSIQINQLTPLKNEYLIWISNIKMRVVHIVQTEKLDHQNDLLLESADLVLKLIGEALSPFFSDDSHIFVDIAVSFGLQFINSFLSKDQNIMGDVKVMKLSHYKKVAEQFIRPFMLICSMDTSLLIQKLAEICDSILQSQNILRISHYLVLIAQISKQNFLQRNVLYESQPKQKFIPLGGIIHKLYGFINLYKTSGNRIEQIQVSIIIFIDTILQQLLLGLDYCGIQVRLNGSILYFLIHSFKTIPSQDEDIVLYHLKELMTNIYSSNAALAQYILDSVYKHLLKIKWGLRRENFKQTKIFANILQGSIQISKNNFSNQFSEAKWRKKLFRVIGFLSFDDIQDSYKQNVNFILQMIQIGFRKELYVKVIFDLTGICQNIDSPIIFRYFLINLDKKVGIKSLMEKLFHTFAQDQVMLKQILKLNISMIQNKAYRFISKQITTKFYEILNILIPFWSSLLSSAIYEGWSDIVKQLYKIMAIMFGEGHINLYLVRRNNKEAFSEFMSSLLKNLSYCHCWVSDFPKIDNSYLQLLNFLSSNHLQMILNHDSNLTIKEFDSVLENILSQVILYFQELVEGKKSVEKLLLRLLDCSKNIFSHLKKAKQFQHKPLQLQNTQTLVTQKSQNKLKFLLQLYKFGFGNGRNFTGVFNLTLLIIYQMSFIYKDSHADLLKQLRIFGKRAQDFQKIYKPISEGKEDDSFVMNLKEWMKQCDNDCEPEIDY